MRRKVELLPRARNDLLDIWLFIAGDNPNVADRVLGRISDIFAMLAETPEGGRARPELGDGLRSFPVGNYMVFYIPSPETIAVVRVLERHRDVEAVFGEETGEDEGLSS